MNIALVTLKIHAFFCMLSGTYHWFQKHVQRYMNASLYILYFVYEDNYQILALY